MKVLSYALFRTRNAPGRGEFFTHRLPAVLRAAFALFPEWRVVIHHDESITTEPYHKALSRLAASGHIDLVHCGESPRMAEGMLWRLLPLWRPSAEYVLCRDLDSLATPRERWCIEAFMRSGRAMSIINDAPAHCPPTPHPYMLGGMVGFYVPRFLERTGLRAWSDVVRWGETHGCNLDGYAGDQETINRLFHPLINGDYHNPRVANGKAQIEPEALTAFVDPEIICHGWRWSEFIGHVFSNVEKTCEFYDRFPTSQPIIEAER